uniref:Uncharacterized protein n=1 Tax=Chlamydomonas euryale TaxID=1486919 RepID=A0A7R9YVN8_9CHLO
MPPPLQTAPLGCLQQDSIHQLVCRSILEQLLRGRLTCSVLLLLPPGHSTTSELAAQLPLPAQDVPAKPRALLSTPAASQSAMVAAVVVVVAVFAVVAAVHNADDG